MFIYLIILYLTQLFNLTFSASTLNAANNKGPCYDITADNYLPNSNICPNEAENVDDPDIPTEKLCSTTTNGRFNLIGLLRNGNAVTDINKERNENCEKQDQIIYSSRCRKSCRTCCLLPEYGSCKDSITNCQISQCGDSTYALNQCQSTCGKCVEVIRQNKDLEYCVDKQNNCASLKEQQKCVDPDIQKDCALTCNDWPINSICRKFTQEVRSTLGISAGGGQVPGGNVAGDIGTNCAENKELCSDQFYKEFMEQYCKSTCINSVTSKSSKECKDKKHTNCVVWKVNGFCDSDFYGDDIRDEYCKETCHRC
uniref:ShKT domain-containing protein n=2 Tax=Meloidogyne TaxID=189290 RepID=A0A914LMW6_MELIC